MKYALWLVPVAILGVTPDVLASGLSWLTGGAVFLIAVGAIDAYLIGARWEKRWDELIREKGGSA